MRMLLDKYYDYYFFQKQFSNILGASTFHTLLYDETKFYVQIGVLLGGEENETRRQMQGVIDFETRLAEITTPQEERRDEEKLYNRMSISDLQRLAPFVSLFY